MEVLFFYFITIIFFCYGRTWPFWFISNFSNQQIDNLSRTAGLISHHKVKTGWYSNKEELEMWLIAKVKKVWYQMVLKFRYKSEILASSKSYNSPDMFQLAYSWWPRLLENITQYSLHKHQYWRNYNTQRASDFLRNQHTLLSWDLKVSVCGLFLDIEHSGYKCFLSQTNKSGSTPEDLARTSRISMSSMPRAYTLSQNAGHHENYNI